MDFTFSAEADDAAALAATILSDHTTPERLAEVDATGLRFDPVLWRALGEAGLLTLTTPENQGGAGLGLVELCRVLVEAGRKVAPIPLASDGAARTFLAQHGRGVPVGSVLSCAIAEEHEYAPRVPVTTATPNGAEYVLSGAKCLVTAATVATSFLVPATTPDGVAVFVVDPAAPGLTIHDQRLSDGDVAGLLELDGVRVTDEQRIGESDGRAAHHLMNLVSVTTSAVQLGIAEGALALTSEYAKTREQFERPIGTFQAVSQRLADGYIDTRLQALTLWQAAWRLDQGLPADDAVATAKLWAADSGHRLAHTTVHIHGGVGIDMDDLPHRYFTTAKRYEFEQGGATDQARRLGHLLASGLT